MTLAAILCHQLWIMMSNPFLMQRTNRETIILVSLFTFYFCQNKNIIRVLDF